MGCNSIGTQGSRSLKQSSLLTIGVTYLLEVDIVNYQSGSPKLFDGVSNTTIGAADGRFSIEFTAGSVDLTFNGVDGFVGSIDNVLIKRILQAP